MPGADWNRLLSRFRRKKQKDDDSRDGRTAFERDYDRVLFCAPVRRLADKTQVFPLDTIDSVRTRLTHSHEVANFGRSLGYRLLSELPSVDPKGRMIPVLLATAGLAHDLGNPPFGHQGEKAIQNWFTKHEDLLDPTLDAAMKADFLKFEGNAQTLRILTRLQIRDDEYGLDLTCGTLSTLLKYPTASDATDKNNVATKKHGYFQSEREIVEEIWDRVGLRAGQRHPLTYVMEASDDIAYSVLDVEDAVKKGLMSCVDVLDCLKEYCGTDVVAQNVINETESKWSEYRKLHLSPVERDEIVMERLRVYAISALVSAVAESFSKNRDAIEAGENSKPLIDLSSAASFCEALKRIAKERAYSDRSVLEIELKGHHIIQCLMTYLWSAVSSMRATKNAGPFQRYIYSRISENYRRVSDDGMLPERYRLLQLVTDMVAGMTDSFALSLVQELHGVDYDGKSHSL